MLLLLSLPCAGNGSENGDKLKRPIQNRSVTWKELLRERYGTEGNRPPADVLQQRCYEDTRRYLALRIFDSEAANNYYFTVNRLWTEQATEDSVAQLEECIRGFYEAYQSVPWEYSYANNERCTRLYRLWNSLCVAWWEVRGSKMKSEEIRPILEQAILHDSQLPLLRGALLPALQKHKEDLLPEFYRYAAAHDNELARYPTDVLCIGDLLRVTENMPDEAILETWVKSSYWFMQYAGLKELMRRFPSNATAREVAMGLLHAKDPVVRDSASSVIILALRKDLSEERTKELLTALDGYLDACAERGEAAKASNDENNKREVRLAPYFSAMTVSMILEATRAKNQYLLENLEFLDKHIRWFRLFSLEVGYQDGVEDAEKLRRRLDVLRQNVNKKAQE